MSIIVTPAQLKAQGEFYTQLAQMTAAGVTLTHSVEMMRKGAPSTRLKRVSERLMTRLERGATFAESLRASGHRFPEFDIALIEAGEASGRLDQCFRILGEYYKERGSLASRVLSQLMYPVFLFHFAVFLFPMKLFTDMVLQGALGRFFSSKLAILIPIYAVILVVLWLFRGDRSMAIRSAIERLTSAIPVVGKLKQSLSLARLCAALEALINAGVTIIEAWDLAARASGSPRIMRAVAEARPRILSGELPSDAISSQSIYPDLFVSSYRTGEVSGQLDETLRRLYRYYQEAATEGLNRFAEWLPRLIYFGVAIAVAYQIVAFYSNYFKTLNDVIGQ
jgi:type II secretory pathway component PulF